MLPSFLLFISYLHLAYLACRSFLFQGACWVLPHTSTPLSSSDSDFFLPCQALGGKPVWRYLTVPAGPPLCGGLSLAPATGLGQPPSGHLSVPVATWLRPGEFSALALLQVQLPVRHLWHPLGAMEPPWALAPPQLTHSTRSLPFTPFLGVVLTYLKG